MKSWMFAVPLVLALAGCGPSSPGAGAPDTANGQKLFTRLCGGCHKAGPDARNGFGPQLNGVVGRQAGSLGDYQYSPAMKQAGFAWDEATLKTYLADPGKKVPGTKMYFWGLANEQQVADLIAWLKTTGHP